MATQLNFDQLKAQIEDAGLSTAAFVTEFNRLRASGADVNSLLRTMNATLDGIQDKGRDIGTTFGSLVTTLKNITSEFSNSDSAAKDVTKSYKGLVSVAQKMQYEEEGIYSYNVKQLKALKDRTAALTVDLNEAMTRMTHEEKLEMYGANYVELLQDRLQAETALNKKIEDR